MSEINQTKAQDFWDLYKPLHDKESVLRLKWTLGKGSSGDWDRLGELRKQKHSLVKVLIGWAPPAPPVVPDPPKVDPPAPPVDDLTPAAKYGVELPVSVAGQGAAFIGAEARPHSADYLRKILAELRIEAAENPMFGTEGDIGILLCPGEINGLAFHMKKYGLERYDLSWIPKGVTLKIYGHPDGTTFKASKEITFVIQPTDGWDGRICFYNCTFEGSKRNTFLIGSEDTNDNPKRNPLKEIGFVDCRFKDNKDPAVQTLRVMSSYQAQLYYIRCKVDVPNSVEHFNYPRNPYGWQVYYECEVSGIGSQFAKEVSRPGEGPQMGPETTYIIGNKIRNCHREADDSQIRGGSAIEMTSTGRNYKIIGNLIEDLEREDGDLCYGAITFWGGTEGKPRFSYGMAGHSIDKIELRDNKINYTDANRDVISIKDAVSLKATGNTINCPNRGVKIGMDKRQAGVWECHWNGNSGEASMTFKRPVSIATTTATMDDEFGWRGSD